MSYLLHLSSLRQRLPNLPTLPYLRRIQLSRVGKMLAVALLVCGSLGSFALGQMIAHGSAAAPLQDQRASLTSAAGVPIATTGADTDAAGNGNTTSSGTGAGGSGSNAGQSGSSAASGNTHSQPRPQGDDKSHARQPGHHGHGDHGDRSGGQQGGHGDDSQGESQGNGSTANVTQSGMYSGMYQLGIDLSNGQLFIVPFGLR